jgi:putative ABC transport system permease protein
MPFPISMRLATRQWLARPLRPILCSLAIAAAVALIVCVGAAFDSIRYSLDAAIGQMLGVAEIHVRPAQKGTEARIPETMLLNLRARPEVEFADGRLQAQASLTKADDHRWFDIVGIDPKLDEILRPKVYLAGHALTGAPHEIVIDGAIADLMSIKVGDSLTFSPDGDTTLPITVVGITKRPSIELIAKPTMYMDLTTLAALRHTSPEYDVIDLKLRDSANIDDFDAYAKSLNHQLGNTVRVSPGTNSKAQLADETRSIQLLLSLLSTISGICAALIIGTTLSVGVQERIRQFGQLRCIGASRKQLVSFLLADALVMLLIGELFGILLGFLASKALVAYFPQFFLAYRLSFSSISIAIVNGCIATLLGAMIPLWQVTRVTPMAAVTSVSHQSRPRAVWIAAAIGLTCLAFQIALWLLTPKEYRFFTYIFLGQILIFLGWTLLGPSLLVLLERLGSRLIAPLFFLKPVLLRGAWSRTPWRTGAMISALMIGVTLFIAVSARGRSLLASWTAPARFPDLFLYSISPVSPTRLDLLKQDHPELIDLTSLAAFPVKLERTTLKNGEVLSNNATTFVAVEPQSFAHLIEMDYFQGDPTRAIHELEDGHHIFVTKEFYNLHNLGLGDKLTFFGADGKPAQFTISAVVSSTGMALVKNYFDMRSLFQDAAVSSVLGSVDDARKIFRLRDTNLLLLNIAPDQATPAHMVKLREQLSREGFQSASSVELKAGLKSLVTRVVDSLSVIAFGALLIASLGVANMVIASVHARRFEFGVLRAIGAGRGQLVRLVLAEVTLIGFIAGILGAAAGLQFAFMATQVDRLLAGVPTSFLATDTPVIFADMALYTLLAIVLTTALAWLAALAPALRGAFAAQRTLLASGRG